MDEEIRPCRYPLAEMNCGAYLGIGYLTAAVPHDARAITLLTPATPGESVRTTTVLVFRRGDRPQPHADNDRDIAFLGVDDRASAIGHPAFEPTEGLEPTKTD
jgi:hypothetical protein